jgi:Na+/H+ antiporter NhaA
MSRFIGLLAFADPEKQAVLLAVTVGSLLSALAGALVMLTAKSSESKEES